MVFGIAAAVTSGLLAVTGVAVVVLVVDWLDLEHRPEDILAVLAAAVAAIAFVASRVQRWRQPAQDQNVPPIARGEYDWRSRRRFRRRSAN